ncbi:MAG: hypothetical protein Q9225_001236 [Loekoesia sp. 1 TL-2023]
MSRYLTPSRIALLALITLYSDGLVPSSATISILSFVISYILPVLSKAREDSIPLDDFTISIEKLQETTITHTSAIPGRTVWDLLLKNLWAISSLDALHAFFDDLPFLLEKPIEESSSETDELVSTRSKRMLLSRNSPLGAFVRRSQLEFTRLQFHDGTSLWKSFIAYRDPTLVFWKRRNPTAGLNSFDSNLQQDLSDADEKLVGLVYGDISDKIFKNANNSTEDTERLLDHQIDRMQRGLLRPVIKDPKLKQFTGIGIRIPHAVQSQLRAMVRPGSAVPDVLYYMQFLEAWKAGDYPSSFENLHRYFDYTMQNGARGMYQYALLNLAILHADFGCFAEAITAMQETIATARENHDLPCLNYSLSWLNQFCRTHARELKDIQKKGVLGSEKEALSFLKAKAKESNMWTLLSTTLLSEAKFLLTNLARRGRYDEALSRMDNVDSETLRALKLQQYWITNLGILKLRRHLYRGELDAGDQVLAQLRAAPAGVQELQFHVSLMEIELEIRREDYPNALALLKELLTEMNRQETDIFQRLKAMILKARVYDKAGTPQKGFSIALRAASLAHKARFLPVLWEAVSAVCRILISVKEFDAAVRLVESVLPQALECEDCELAASLFSCLADGHMGTAGQAKAGSLQRKERLSKTSESLDRAFDEYSKIEDMRGQCEMMAKKATIMHLNGDPVLANDCAAKYLAIKKAAREQN